MHLQGVGGAAVHEATEAVWGLSRSWGTFEVRARFAGVLGARRLAWLPTDVLQMHARRILHTTGTDDGDAFATARVGGTVPERCEDEGGRDAHTRDNP